MLPSLQTPRGALTPREARRKRENVAIAVLEARLARGEITPEQADAEILELALERFAFMPPAALDELRELGRELFEEPEMIETRALAPRPPDDDEP